jgi:MT0933-like antitoxin protein
MSMSFVDKVKQFLGQHGDQVDKVIEKAGDMADEKTGGKYADKIDMAQEKARRAAGTTPEDDGRR